jgi:hypothetical protein
MKSMIIMFFLVALMCWCSGCKAAEAIGWIPSWNQALSEAKATQRPILLVSGAPACAGVPGVW